MPFGELGTYVCRNLQTDLVSHFGKNAPQNRTLGSVSLIKWLLSPQNTSLFKKISDDVQGVPGKVRGVAFLVNSPFCFDLCKADRACTVEKTYTNPASQEVVFELAGAPWRHCNGAGTPIVLQFKEADLMKYCTITDTSWVQEQISRYLLRWEEALDKSLTARLETEIGTNASAEAVTNIPLFTGGNMFNPTMSVLNPEAQWYLNQVYQNIGMEGQFGLIGGDIVNKVNQFLKWSCCNNAGVDMSKADAVNPYLFYNRNFNETFGNRDMVIMAPGATQLVTWNKYKGEKQRAVTNLYSHGTVILPTTGLEVDWKWAYDQDCEAWTFEALLYNELATVVPGGCGDDVAGVNGLIRVHDCSTQPLIPECPEVPEA